MSTPQRGIFIEGNRFLHVLEYTLNDGASPESIAVALQAARESNVEVVVAFGSSLWARLAHDRMPKGFTDFQTIEGPKARITSTQRDILVWLHGPTRDDVLDAAMAVDGVLSTVAKLELDLPGFVYRDSRDLTGFVDGSANPEDDAGKREAALVPEGELGTGGAIVFSSTWEHDLHKFHAQSVEDQENVIGRTKADSIELEGDDLPVNSHVGRTDIKVDDVAQKMYRRSFPYGTAGKPGLYFIAFCCEQERLDNVINNMYGLGQDGVTDHLLDFTTPVTGSYWFAPCEEDLEAALS